jgi:hypothetical protein
MVALKEHRTTGKKHSRTHGQQNVLDVTTSNPKQETTETYKATKDENQQKDLHKDKVPLKGGQKNVGDKRLDWSKIQSI